MCFIDFFVYCKHLGRFFVLMMGYEGERCNSGFQQNLNRKISKIWGSLCLKKKIE